MRSVLDSVLLDDAGAGKENVVPLPFLVCCVPVDHLTKPAWVSPPSAEFFTCTSTNANRGYSENRSWSGDVDDGMHILEEKKKWGHIQCGVYLYLYELLLASHHLRVNH